MGLFVFPRPTPSFHHRHCRRRRRCRSVPFPCRRLDIFFLRRFYNSVRKQNMDDAAMAVPQLDQFVLTVRNMPNNASESQCITCTTYGYVLRADRPPYDCYVCPLFDCPHRRLCPIICFFYRLRFSS